MPPAPRTILIVEPDPDIRDLIALILRDAGYRATRAAGEAAARAALAARRYDLVLLDTLGVANVRDPGRWAAVGRVWAAAGGTPTMLATPYPPAAFADWRARGFAGLIAKPFDCDDLLAAVAAALGGDTVCVGGGMRQAITGRRSVPSRAQRAR
ncbi:MAG TPA: response regulator, partial [Thermomicrobiales bacterium]|nr:response regulator [Thermomicrobiales bacterium]